MSSPVLRATVAVVVLALLGATTGALGAYELSQPTAASSSTSTNYSADLLSSLNASIRSNPVYPSTNLTNPSAIFSNLTTSLSLSFWYQFAASRPLPVAGVFSSDATFYSGTSPAWSISVYSMSRPLFYNSSAMSYWVATPVTLSSISSALNRSLAIDSEFGLDPGSGTLTVNASFEIDLPGGVVAENNTSVAMAFVYSSGQPGSAAYSAINSAYSAPGTASGGWTTTDTNPLPSHAVLEDVLLATAVVAFVTAALVGVLYLPRQRPSTLERFLADNAENVVRVTADTRVARKAVRVENLEELVKLANLSNQPIFLFETPTGALLYVVQGETTFAYDLPSEAASRDAAS